ncbi:protein phosphatase 2C domain-containing protein [Nonomuraea sp. NPDC050404]|uniref:protein phosphatase 2C domain-containing protein n=1 Tax=Nonomuraea sp. NPDC050404 TaxID=3155783 RepID=UPI0033DDB639
MDVSFALLPGSDQNPNEDAVAATADVLVVIDGVSTSRLATGCMHGTPWYANALAAQVVAAASKEPGKDLRAVLFEALRSVAASHADTCDLTSDGTPSATVAIARPFGDRLDYLVLSDATIAIETKTGVEVISDKRVDALVGELSSAAKKAVAGSEEQKQRLEKLITTQRKLRNVEGGYWLAGAVPEAAEHAVVGSVPLCEVRSIAVMTDGASCLVDVYALMDWNHALRMLAVDGPGAWLRRVREAEQADTNKKRWPRYKVSDDATIALCRELGTSIS